MGLQNIVARDASSTMALDARALSGLKQQAKAAPDEALRGAAGQFEALFLQMLLKTMRDALPQDGPFASETTKTYTAMFDQQMAQQLAKKGVGVADLLVKQLSPRTTPVPTATATTSVTGAPVPARTPGITKPATTEAAGATDKLASTAARIAVGAASLTETARAFIEKMRPHAEAVAQAAGIPASFLLAQAALETGWGRHQPRSADGVSSNNLFGIKAGGSWTGAKAVAATTEYVAGKAVTALESFRAYGSHTEAFQDFARLIRGNPRYAGVVANTGDAAAYARSLQQAGYATDPRYAEKLTRTIEAVARHAAGGGAQVPTAAAVKRNGSA